MVRDSLVCLLLAVGVAALSLWLVAPPEPRAVGGDAGEFDWTRAAETVERLARAPRPPGSPAHRRTREFLVERLEELGLEVEVQATTGIRVRESLVVAAELRNVVGRLRGTGDGTAVLFVAHYDSRPHTPGAGDDAAGVAALLEALRALAAGPVLRNDLVVLFSDAEEVGLLGAEAFADEHRWMDDVAAVVNFEGRGNRGPSVMFETGEGSSHLVREMARSTPAPIANSLSYEIYKRMPNDTDFSIFKRRGLPGLNFGFIGNLPAYHSSLDFAAALSPASLQHHGTSALALARRLGEIDLARPSTPNVVYFNPIGSWIVTYSASMALPLALLASGLLIAAIVLLRRRARGGWSELLGGLGGWVGVLLLSPIAVWVGWNLLHQAGPGLTRAPNGAIYAQGPLSLAATMLVVAVAIGVFSSADHEPSRSPQMAGVLAGWSVLALASAALMPGASYLFTWPLMIGSVGLLVLAFRAPSPSFEIVVFGAVSLSAVALFAPTIDLLFEALTLEVGWVVAIFAGLLITLLGPLLAIATRGRGAAVATAIALGAFAIAGWVLFNDRIDERRPRTDGLFYLLDGDSGGARWMSPATSAGWAREILGQPQPVEDVPAFLGSTGRAPKLVAWRAPSVELEAPTIRLVDDTWEEDGDRVLTLGVESRRDASTMWIAARSLVEIRGVRIDGRSVRLEASTDRVRILYFGRSEGELKLGFEMEDRQPIELQAADQTFGLPQVEAVSPGRGRETIVDPRWASDSTLVSATAWN